ncbi:MAG: NAD(P)-binding protein, partial [Candidatus Nitrosocosmicus sp.]
MKFAIIGAGVAGSYLGNILHSNGHKVTIFEAYEKEKHWPVCAWGASRHMLEHFSNTAGLQFKDYILHVGKKIRMQLPYNKEESLELDG